MGLQPKLLRGCNLNKPLPRYDGCCPACSTAISDVILGALFEDIRYDQIDNARKQMACPACSAQIRVVAMVEFQLTGVGKNDETRSPPSTRLWQDDSGKAEQ